MGIDNDLWRTVQFAALAVFLCAMVGNIYRKLGSLITAVVMVQMAIGLYILYFGYAQEPKFTFRISTTVGQALLWLVLSCGIVIRIGLDQLNLVRRVFVGVGLINSALMLGSKAIGPMIGMVPSPAANGALVACCLPFLLSTPASSYFEKGLKLHMIAIMAGAVFASGGATGIAALVAIAAVYLIGRTISWLKVGGLVGCAAFGVLVLAPRADIVDFFSSRGRVQHWSMMFTEFCNGTWVQALFGRGIGTYEWLSPLQSFRTSNPTQVWLWAHNEPLQVLFENGFMGFAALALLGIKVCDGLKTRELQAVAAAYGIAMLTTNPMRSAPFQILGACLVGITCWHETTFERLRSQAWD